tara:strand:+ start:139 stop:762 length:624 start_codon:yes stop_codon:yes gene_type:complete
MGEEITPFDEKISDLMLGLKQTNDQKEAAMLEWSLAPRQLCDLELLINGGFAPLNGFMSQADYQSVLASMRLQNGTLWPMPITLDVSRLFAQSVKCGAEIALRDPEGMLVAILTVTDIWRPDKSLEAKAVFGADDMAHPAVCYLHKHAGEYYVGGKLKKAAVPTHYDFRHLRHTPAELKAQFQKLGWKKLLRFKRATQCTVRIKSLR